MRKTFDPIIPSCIPGMHRYVLYDLDQLDKKQEFQPFKQRPLSHRRKICVNP